MGRRRIECSKCRKNKRMMDIVDCDNNSNTVLEYKCPKCGTVWTITVNGEEIKLEEVEITA